MPWKVNTEYKWLFIIFGEYYYIMVLIFLYEVKFACSEYNQSYPSFQFF